MTLKATFSLNEDSFNFLKSMVGNNKSAYLNRLILAEKKLLLKTQIAEANLEEAQDLEYQDELSKWQTTLSDGLIGE